LERTVLERLKKHLVVESRFKQPITERTRLLRDETIARVPKLCAERACLYTESWKETEGQPTVLRRAKALEKILSEMTIFIRPTIQRNTFRKLIVPF
jgi:formate C-acetyltransferase